MVINKLIILYYNKLNLVSLDNFKISEKLSLKYRYLHIVMVVMTQKNNLKGFFVCLV